jgi:hypothetical protein
MEDDLFRDKQLFCYTCDQECCRQRYVLAPVSDECKRYHDRMVAWYLERWTRTPDEPSDDSEE